MAPIDFYQVLDVPRTATKKEIQQAFRRLARKYHPDVAGGDKASEEKFKAVNAAYEVLSEPKKRTAYDKWGDQWMHAEQLEKMERQGAFRQRGPGFDFRAAPGGMPGGGYEEVFQDLGGGGFGNVFDRLFRQTGAPRGGPQPGQDLETVVQVSLAEAFQGTTRTITIQGPQPRRLEVKVPPGVDEGSKIRLGGKGQPGAGGGPPGDVILKMRVAADPRFERKGADLHTHVRAPLATMVLGGEVTVPTLTGSVALKIPALTQNGRAFRLTGKGMPVLNRDQRGDLFVHADVVLPETLSAEALDLFRRLQDLEDGANASTPAGEAS